MLVDRRDPVNSTQLTALENRDRNEPPDRRVASRCLSFGYCCKSALTEWTLFGNEAPVRHRKYGRGHIVSDAGDVEEKDRLRILAGRTAMGVLALFTATVVLAYWWREPIGALATDAIDVLGTPGVFLGVLASDTLAVPIPPSTYVFAGVAAESPMVVILTVAIITSIAAASIAYVIGPHIGRIPFFARQLEHFRPRAERLFERWGMWAVGIAAITPLPFALICWLAGIYRMRYAHFFTATLVRGPRILGYYGIFVLGWTGVAI